MKILLGISYGTVVLMGFITEVNSKGKGTRTDFSRPLCRHSSEVIVDNSVNKSKNSVDIAPKMWI